MVQGSACVEVKTEIRLVAFFPDVQGDMGCLNHYDCRETRISLRLDVLDVRAADFVHADVIDEFVQPFLQPALGCRRCQGLAVYQQVLVKRAFENFSTFWHVGNTNLSLSVRIQLSQKLSPGTLHLLKVWHVFWAEGCQWRALVATTYPYRRSGPGMEADRESPSYCP